MKLRLLIVLCAIVLGLGVIIGALHPAGSKPMAARKTALAMRGRNVFVLMSKSGLWGRKELFDVFPDDCQQSMLIASALRMQVKPEDLHNLFDKDGSLWQFALIDYDEVGDGFPVMISANFNANDLGKYAIGDHLPIGRGSGAERSLLDYRAIVVVRKNGTSQILSENHLTRQTLFLGEKSDEIRYCSVVPFEAQEEGGGQSVSRVANRSDSESNSTEGK